LGAWGTLIHEKNLKSKISCQTPFNHILNIKDLSDRARLLNNRYSSYKFNYCDKSETCIAFLLHVGSAIAKAKKPNVNTGLDKNQHEAVNLAE
jgi:hypothetical protein